MGHIIQLTRGKAVCIDCQICLLRCQKLTSQFAACLFFLAAWYMALYPPSALPALWERPDSDSTEPVPQGHHPQNRDLQNGDWGNWEKVNESRINNSVRGVVLCSWGEKGWWYFKSTAQQYGFLSCNAQSKLHVGYKKSILLQCRVGFQLYSLLGYWYWYVSLVKPALRRQI